jgi:hypothetical protein
MVKAPLTKRALSGQGAAFPVAGKKMRSSVCGPMDRAQMLRLLCESFHTVHFC